MKKLLVFTLICLFAGEVFGQYFIPGTESFSKKKESTVVLKDGSEHILFYDKAKRKKGVFAEVFFTDADGNEKVFMADDIQTMAIPPSDLGKLIAFSEGTESVLTMTKTKFSDCVKTDFAYFEQAILPGKKPIPVLFQVVNPGFDSKVKVYHDPYAQETAGVAVGGMQMTGGMEKSYYVTKDGETFKALKGKYKKEVFPALFGDSPEMMEKYEKGAAWKDFATHVFEYDQLGK